MISAIYQYSVPKNYPKANISLFKIKDQDRLHVGRDTREAIHIIMNNAALNHNMEKCISQKSSTTFFKKMDLPMSLIE